MACPCDQELWGFQRADVAYALRRKSTLIGDQPGLGKTPVAICFANEIKAKRVLVVCPASIRLRQRKTGAEVEIVVAAELAAIVRATPAVGVYVITDAAGRPVVGDTLSAIIRRSADAAGLPRHCVAHGLRKAMGRRLAENGASAREIAAVLGHKSLAQVTLYTDAADRARLAGTAIARLARAGGQTRPKGTKRDR